MAGVLSIVATPIGNLEDITYRAVRVLKEADVIAAEDTRRTKKLLAHYGIATKLTSYYEHNEKTKGPWLIERLEEGSLVALVTDAGTPAISDPGYRLVKAAVDRGIKVVACPGASAVIAALSIGGLPTDAFSFRGFVPSSAGKRRSFLSALGGEQDETVVLYESPRRLEKTLIEIENSLGDVPVVVAREMTKLHEEVLRGSVSEVLSLIEGRSLKGEITLLVSVKAKDASEGLSLTEEVATLLASGTSPSAAARTAAARLGVTKKVAYAEALRQREACSAKGGSGG